MSHKALDNLAEYEGYLEVDEALVGDLCAAVAQLIADAQRLIDDTATPY